MLILLVVGLVVVFLGIAGLVFWTIKKTDPKNIDTSLNPNADSAQDFLPFQDIRDGMVNLGANRYRAYLEVGSINYHLRTGSEREMIERSYHRFLNSLTLPTAHYIQTRTLDMTEMLKEMEQEIEEVIEVFPQLAGYGRRYYKEMQTLTDYVGNNKQKKKFIIVTFDNAAELEGLSESEKYEYALKEMDSSLIIVRDGLSGLGLEARILRTAEVAELVYATYHKDNYKYVENIVSGEALTMLVEGQKEFTDDDLPEARLDWILFEALNRIVVELDRTDLDELMMKDVEMAVSSLNKMREDLSGFYLERDNVMDRKELDKHSNIKTEEIKQVERGVSLNAKV